MRVFVLTGLVLFFIASAPLDADLPPGTIPIDPRVTADRDMPGSFKDQPSPTGSGSVKLSSIKPDDLSWMSPAAGEAFFTSFSYPSSECTDTSYITGEVEDEPLLTGGQTTSWTEGSYLQADAIYDDGLDASLAGYPTGGSFRARGPTALIHWVGNVSLPPRRVDRIPHDATFLCEIGLPAITGRAPPPA